MIVARISKAFFQLENAGRVFAKIGEGTPTVNVPTTESIETVSGRMAGIVINHTRYKAGLSLKGCDARFGFNGPVSREAGKLKMRDYHEAWKEGGIEYANSVVPEIHLGDELMP